MSDIEWLPEPGTSQPFPPPAWTPPPPAPVRKRGTRRRVGVAAAVTALLAGLVTWLVWPSSGPTLTYRGKPVADAGKALSTTESVLKAYVKNRHGATDSTTRCYFSELVNRAHKAARDVGDAVWCGPVLFVDGDATKPYIVVPMTVRVSGARATMTPPRTLDVPYSYALDPSFRLVRPDGRTPASRSTLAVPAPPRAARGVLTVDTLGPVTAPRSVGTRMLGKTAGVVLDAAGIVPRYGTFDDARRAPPGQQLLAFQFHIVPGDASEGFTTQAQVVVDGGRPRQVPQTDSADQWDVVAIGVGSTAILRMRDGGYTQTLSLPDGRPGAHNLAVLGRLHRAELLHSKPAVPASLSNGANSVSVTFHAHATIAALDYWVPGHPTKHASGPSRAILTVHVTYTDPNQPGKTFGFEPALLRLRLPDGHYVHANNVAREKNFVFDVFEVPATFTRGTVQITGSDDLDGITLTITKTVDIAVSIPAS